MGIGDRERHQHVGFVTSEAKHQSLVTRPLFKIHALAFIYPLGDVFRLLVEGNHDRAAGMVIAHFR